MITRRTFVVASMLLTLTACTSRELGYGGAHPGGIVCYGKGVVTFNGAGTATAMFGGSEMNGGNITVDCGTGIGLIQGTPDEIQKIIDKTPSLKLGAPPTVGTVTTAPLPQ